MHRTNRRIMAESPACWLALSIVAASPWSALGQGIGMPSSFPPSAAAVAGQFNQAGQVATTLPGSQPLPNQPNNPQASGATANQAWNRPVYSFIDPRNGIVYDRFLENEQVPSMVWKTVEATERRWVPEVQTENQQVTRVEYVPVMSYETKTNTPSRWNPFANNAPAAQQVPRVDYVPVNRVVTMPVQVQRYVEREIKVQVPKMVPETESRVRYVDRPRAGQPLGNLAQAIQANPSLSTSAPRTNYATQPVYPNLSGGYLNPASGNVPLGYQANSVAVPSPVFSMQPPSYLQAYPSSPVIAPTAPVANAPGYVYAAPNTQPFFQFGGRSAPASSPVLPAAPTSQTPLVPVQSPQNSIASSNRPLLRWPNWLGGNGPLLKTSLFRENRLLPNGVSGGNPALASVASPNVGFGGSVAYAYQQPVLPNNSAGLTMNQNFNATLPQQPRLAGNLSVQPSTTPTAFPARTAEQVGMPATQLR